MVKVWDCIVVSESFLKYYTPGQKYIELHDGSIPTDQHYEHGYWSSFSHEDGIVSDGGDEAVFCLLPSLGE